MKKIAFAVATAAAITSAVVGTSFIASAQDQSAATPVDVIFARKTLMDSIASNMSEIEAMTGSGKIDLAKGRGHAELDLGNVSGIPPPLPTNYQYLGAECSAGIDNRHFH